MHRIIVLVVVSIAVAGCTGRRAAPHPEFSEQSKSAEICALVQSIGHFFPGKDDDSALRWFIHTRIMSSPAGSPFPPGNEQRFWLHSPARAFSLPRYEIEGRTFMLHLELGSSGWTVQAAHIDPACSPS